MVGTTLNIEREIEDTRSTRDAGVGSKREDKPSSSSGKRQKTYASHEFQTRVRIRHVKWDCPQRQGVDPTRSTGRRDSL